MAQQPAHYDIYREELGKAYPGFGYALWDPDPGDQSPVEVGDVGFIRRGRFHRLFNALLPADHASHDRFGVPEYHEPLHLTVMDHTYRGALTPNSFHSRGVTQRSGGLEVLAGTVIGSAEVSFSCTKKLGASMSLPVTARCEDTLTLGHFRKWISKNIDTWYAFTELHGLGLDMEDIILVTGFHRTRSWSNVAFAEVHTDAQFSFGVEVTGTFGANINWRASNDRIQGAVLSQGPSGENLPENQCIFIRGFRVKRIFGIIPWLKAAAEPRSNSRWDDREQETQVVPMLNVTQYQDPLHVILEYIASHATDCHLALVHDFDLEQILGTSDGNPLESLKPDVLMEHLLLLQRSELEIRIVSDVFSTNADTGMDTAPTRVAMLTEGLHSFELFGSIREKTNQFILSEPIHGNIFPPTSEQPHLSSQIDGTSLTASSSSRQSRSVCPACSAEFYRLQEWKRHLMEIHLPQSMHCPQCSWTGSRPYQFRGHWIEHHGLDGRDIPEEEKFKMYDARWFADQINAGTMTVDDATATALKQIRVKAARLERPSLLANAMAKKLRAGSSSEKVASPAHD